jgi:hypothetical protein
MSLGIEPPFAVVSRVAEPGLLDPGMVNLRRLRDVVRGTDATFPRVRAMALLLDSDFPNKHRDFETVLGDAKEPPEIRCAAAMNLGRINTPASVEILVRNCRVRDEQVMAGVMKALGRIGDAGALDAVRSAGERAKGPAASQAAFTSLLITHRSGLQEGGDGVPQTGPCLELDPRAAREFAVAPECGSEIELCLRCLGDRPFGIELAEDPAYSARCGRNRWMMLFNREFAGPDAVGKLRMRKAIAGVIARRSRETGWYSVSHLLLTAPMRDDSAITLLMYRTNGELDFQGRAEVQESHAAFSILALLRPGAFAVRIEGTFDDGRLEIHAALSAPTVQFRRTEPAEEAAP